MSRAHSVSNLVQQSFGGRAGLVIGAKAAGFGESFPCPIQIPVDANGSDQVKSKHRAGPGIIAIARHLKCPNRALVATAGGLQARSAVCATRDEAKGAGLQE
jgi:hypothetical protein